MIAALVEIIDKGNGVTEIAATGEGLLLIILFLVAAFVR
jgi:hypothetical protein